MQREGDFAELPVPKSAKFAATKVEYLFKMGESKPDHSRSGNQDVKAGAPSETAPAAAAEATSDQAKTAPVTPLPAAPAGSDDKKKAQPAAAVSKESLKDIDARLDQLVKQQIQRNNDTENTLEQIRDGVQQMREAFDARDKKKDSSRILGFDSFEDWLGSRASIKELSETSLATGSWINFAKGWSASRTATRSPNAKYGTYGIAS